MSKVTDINDIPVPGNSTNNSTINDNTINNTNNNNIANDNHDDNNNNIDNHTIPIITFQPDEEIYNHIKKLAKKWYAENRSYVIRRIIREHIKLSKLSSNNLNSQD